MATFLLFMRFCRVHWNFGEQGEGVPVWEFPSKVELYLDQQRQCGSLCQRLSQNTNSGLNCVALGIITV